MQKIKQSPSYPYMVLQFLPREKAQIDFGYIGTLKVKGCSKKAWVFAMSLSYSCYLYAQTTFDQSISTFIRCHINGFRFFGGVPQTIKIDNLKAGIIEADFYEPVVQRTYAEFAKHYGFLPNPCRIYTPTDKGKREFVNSHNGELLGAYGNFVNRTLAFIFKYLDVTVLCLIVRR
jgi:transposase